MKIYLKLYLKLFLRAGIFFLVYFAVIESIEHGFPKGLSEGLFMGIFMALWMTLFMGSLHIRAIRRITSGKYDEKDVLSVHHIRNIELQLPYDKTFDMCVSSLSLIKKCKIQKEDHSQGEIQARVGIFLGGHIVLCKVSKIDDNKTKVEVSSKPAFRPTLIDGGRNLSYVMKIIDFLKNE